jgi:hypothetical protein
MSRVMDELQPDAVILLYVTNDIEVHEYPFNPGAEVLSFSEKSPPQVARMLLGTLWMYRLASHIYTYAGSTTADADANAMRSLPGWKRSISSIERIKALADERAVPSLFFLFSWADTQLEDALLTDISSAAAGSPVIETLPWFTGLNLQDFRNSIVDSHPNAGGHDILARGIAAAVSDVARRTDMHR